MIQCCLWKILWKWQRCITSSTIFLTCDRGAWKNVDYLNRHTLYCWTQLNLESFWCSGAFNLLFLPIFLSLRTSSFISTFNEIKQITLASQRSVLVPHWDLWEAERLRKMGEVVVQGYCCFLGMICKIYQYVSFTGKLGRGKGAALSIFREHILLRFTT